MNRVPADFFGSKSDRVSFRYKYLGAEGDYCSILSNAWPDKQSRNSMIGVETQLLRGPQFM